MGYAEKTTVSVASSQNELSSVLRRHKADRVAIGQDDREGIAVVSFELQGRIARMQWRVPTLDYLDKHAKKPNGWHTRTRDSKDKWLRGLREQHERRVWRVLILVVKGRLELIEEGYVTFEHAFFADLVLPGGRTVFEEASPRIAEAYATGELPKLLP